MPTKSNLMLLFFGECSVCTRVKAIWLLWFYMYKIEMQNQANSHKRDLCLVLLLGQNIFCPGQNWNCPRQNFCPGLKTTFFAFKSHAKWIFVVENRFPIRKFCFKWLLKAKNVLFNPGQNFYLGQFQFCPGQKNILSEQKDKAKVEKSYYCPKKFFCGCIDGHWHQCRRTDEKLEKLM